MAGAYAFPAGPSPSPRQQDRAGNSGFEVGPSGQEPSAGNAPSHRAAVGSDMLGAWLDRSGSLKVRRAKPVVLSGQLAPRPSLSLQTPGQPPHRSSERCGLPDRI